MPLKVHGLANPGQGLDMLHHKSVLAPSGPMGHHADSMAMDVIRPKDVPKGKQLYPKDDAQSLRNYDIEGAAPLYPHKHVHVDGPPFKEPIPGTVARTHYPEINRVIDGSLTTRDIEKAQPQVDKFRTSRVTNPLTPRYELPSFQELPPDVPGVRIHEGRVRDTMEFKGVTEKPRIPTRNYVRDPNEHRDIEYSHYTARNRFSSRGTTPRDNVDKTVERAGERILSSKCPTPRTHCPADTTPRTSCPLNPMYDVPSRTTHPFLRGEDESHYAPRSTGFVEKAAPKVLHRDNGEPQASLIRADLPGAVPQRYKGSTPFCIYDPPEVTPFAGGLQLNCKDIEGAQTGTRKPGTRI